MKKIFKALALALAGAMFMVACDDTPAPYNPNPGGGEGGKDTTVVTEKKITCAEAAELCGKLTDGSQSAETYVITGYITDVFANISNHQQSFWMADTKDGGKVVQAFWANLPEGVEKFTVGSKVTITGKLLKYVKADGIVTPEMKNADVTIHEVGGGTVTPDQPVEGTPAGTGVESDPYNVAGALAYIQTLSAEDKPEALVYTKGVISEVVKLGESGSIRFKMHDKNVNNSLLVFYCNNLGNVPFKAQTDLKVGDEVIVCGKVVNYGGNTPEYNAGAYLVSLNGKTEGEGGGSTPGGEEKPGEVTEFSIDLAYTLGTNAYDNGMATINGVEDCKTLKIGTAKATGSFTLTMPAGKHTFYAVAWKGTASADVTFSNGNAVVKTVTVKGNTGATGNAPYTISVTDADKYEIELAQDATITVTSDKRIVFFGIK